MDAACAKALEQIEGKDYVDEAETGWNEKLYQVRNCVF